MRVHAGVHVVVLCVVIARGSWNNDVVSALLYEKIIITMCQKNSYLRRVLFLQLLISYELTEPVAGATCSQICHYVPWARDADCSRRHLHQIPQECVGSKVLNLNKNNISVLPGLVFSSFHHLKYLQILGSKVQVVQANSFAGARRLKSINLLYNAIARLPSHSFNDTVSLKWVYLTGNRIATIESGVFQEVPQIEMLYLDDNQLDHLDEGAFQGLSKMQRLLLGGNKLQDLSGDIFSDLTLLNYLDLSRNQLRSLSRDTFQGLRHLKTINLAGNGLTNIAPGTFSFSSISYLDISNNSLTTLVLNHHELGFLKEINAKDNHWNCDCSLDQFRQVLLMTSHSGVLCEKPDSRVNTNILSYYNLCLFPTPHIPVPTETPKRSIQMARHDSERTDPPEEEIRSVDVHSSEIITLIVVVSIAAIAIIAIGMFLFVFVLLPSFQRKRRKFEEKVPTAQAL